MLIYTVLEVFLPNPPIMVAGLGLRSDLAEKEIKMLKTLITTAAMLTATLTPSFAFADVTVPEGRVLEIVYLDLKHGQHDAFFDEYFSPINEIIEDHGGRWLGKFEVIETHEGDLMPDYVLVLDYASVEDFKASNADPKASDLLATRGNYVRDVKISLFNLDAPVNFSSEPGMMFEFFGADMASPDAPAQLGEFFGAVMPVAADYGRQDVAGFQPPHNAGGNLTRMVNGIASWKSAAAFNQFVTTEAFLNGIRDYRDPALKDLYMVNAVLVAK